MTRLKVKTRSDHDVAHLQPLTNVPAKYQLPTPYGCRDIARTRFSNSRSLRQGQRSDHDVAHLHLPTNVPAKYKLFPAARPPAHLPAHPDTVREKNTLTALKPITPKQCPYQLSTSYTLQFHRN